MPPILPPERLPDLPDERGLSRAEVEARRRRYGPNDILEAPPGRRSDFLQAALRDPMVWFLLGAALLFVASGERMEGAILVTAIVPLLGMDAYLHRRTRLSTESLAGRLAARATVVRDGVAIEVPAMELVPGDLAVVAAGESFPADGLLVAGAGLQVDESALTGEAMPVRKRPCAAPAAGRVDDAHLARAGTRLLTGEARLRVLYTGGETLYGEIVRSVQAGRQARTPLQREVGSLVAVLLVAAGALCLALALTRLAQGHGAVDALLSGATLAVAAIPEEFPVVFTFFLGVGVYRLARVEALVRRAVAVEDIGRVTCICSDKTGTLTEGSLRLAHVLPADGVTPDAVLAAAAAASHAAATDPLDHAVLEHAAARPARTVFPFTEDRRRETAIAEADGGALLAFSKGAPETVLAMCRLADGPRSAWRARTQALAEGGHKVIACARRGLADWPGGEPDRDYEFLGLLAFEDPLRPGVAEAVAQARAAGIRVIMVTGDHPRTAAAVAREAGIGEAQPRVVEAGVLAERLRADPRAALQGCDVVARCLPAFKLDLVRALQAAGESVAVTGDGVNDVPALQGADIGIAMGARGTRAAREVAAIVLLDDNFRTIVRAIAEGRQLFDNLRLSFAYLLMVHIPLVLTAALIPFAGFPLLYLPIHVVWLELIIHPTALLVFQQHAAEGGPPPAPRERRPRFFDGRQWALIAAAGALVTLLIVPGFVLGLGGEQPAAHARSVGLLMLVAGSAGITAGLTRLAWPSARLAVLATLASALGLLQIPDLAVMLHLTPLHADDWARALAGGLAVAALCAGFSPRAAPLPRGSAA